MTDIIDEWLALSYKHGLLPHVARRVAEATIEIIGDSYDTSNSDWHSGRLRIDKPDV